MKRTSISAALVLLGAALLGSPLLAQTDVPTPPAQSDAPPPPPPDGMAPGHGPMRGPMGNPEQRLEHLQHALKLSGDQTTQVKGILEAERAKVEGMRANSGLSPEDRRAQMMANREDTNSKIRAVLTPEQASRYDAMEARMREHRHGPPPPPQPAGTGSEPGPGAGPAAE